MNDTRRLQTIDALRGAAILLVVAYHAGPFWLRPPPFGDDGRMRVPHLGAWWLAVPLLHFGYTGVNLFFVLSGFCIHLRAARQRRAPTAPPTRLRDFFLRRFWRIYPPYWIALALFGIVVPAVAPLVGRVADAASARDLALHALMLHTLSVKTIFSINPAFWSLATEEQFYLAYPLVLVALERHGMRRVLAAALALSLAWRGVTLWALWPVPPTAERLMEYRVWVHAVFAPRWFEWLLGCALAEAVASPAPSWMERRRALAVASAALLVAAMACRLHVVADKLFADELWSAGYAALAAALLARAHAGRRIVGGAATVPSAGVMERALAWVGRRAYGIYLVHQPILDGRWLALPLRLGLAAAASVGFSAWCERPFERRAQRVGRPPRPRASPPSAVAPPQSHDASAAP